MPSQLRQDELDRLVPILASLARLIAAGRIVGEAHLRLLLSGVDMANEGIAYAEIKRWANLLMKLRDDPSADTRHAIAESMALRGLPEASILLAIDMVAAAPSLSTDTPATDDRSPQMPRTSVASLDLGLLEPGHSGSAAIEVEGGPGQIEVDGDRVHVEPLTFGSGPTRVHITVSPHIGVFWGTIRFRHGVDVLEVPVLAQWRDAVQSSALPPVGRTIVTESPQNPIQPATRRAPFLLVGAAGALTLMLVLKGLNLLITVEPGAQLTAGDSSTPVSTVAATATVEMVVTATRDVKGKEPVIVRLTVTAEPNVVTVTAPAGSSGPSGHIAFYSDRQGNDEIYIMDANGNNTRRLTEDPAADTLPALSPNGKRIAFVSNRDGNDEIYVVEVEGAAVHRLTTDPSEDRLPAWSPDGERIVFTSSRSGSKDLYVMEGDGSNQTQVLDVPVQAGHATWSPNGEALVYNIGTTDDSTWEIEILYLANRRRRTLTHNRVTDWAPQWSPSGTQILYFSKRLDSADLWVMDVGGGNEQIVHGGSDYEWGGSWSPDGQYIVFSIERANRSDLFRVRSDGSELVRLTTSGGAFASWSR